MIKMLFVFFAFWSILIVGIASWQYMSSGEKWHAVKMIVNAGIVAALAIAILFVIVTLF